MTSSTRRPQDASRRPSLRQTSPSVNPFEKSGMPPTLFQLPNVAPAEPDVAEPGPEVTATPEPSNTNASASAIQDKAAASAAIAEVVGIDESALAESPIESASKPSADSVQPEANEPAPVESPKTFWENFGAHAIVFGLIALVVGWAVSVSRNSSSAQQEEFASDPSGSLAVLEGDAVMSPDAIAKITEDLAPKNESASVSIELPRMAEASPQIAVPDLSMPAVTVAQAPAAPTAPEPSDQPISELGPDLMGEGVDVATTVRVEQPGVDVQDAINKASQSVSEELADRLADVTKATSQPMTSPSDEALKNDLDALAAQVEQLSEMQLPTKKLSASPVSTRINTANSKPAREAASSMQQEFANVAKQLQSATPSMPKFDFADAGLPSSQATASQSGINKDVARAADAAQQTAATAMMDAEKFFASQQFADAQKAAMGNQETELPTPPTNVGSVPVSVAAEPVPPAAKPNESHAFSRTPLAIPDWARYLPAPRR